MCKKQEVYLSRNQMGQPGLFTNGFLVYHLDSFDGEEAKRIAERSGFSYVTGPQPAEEKTS